MSEPKTALIRDLLKHLAKYEATPPTLEDGEAYHLTLTQDGKLRTYDPTVESKVDEVEAKLDHEDHGLAALKALMVIVQEDLDDPDQYKADVSELALEATLTAIKGDGWTDETLVTLKAWMDARAAERGTDGALLAADYVTERGTDGAELEADAATRYEAIDAELEEIRQKATGPAWNQDTDSLEAIREAIDARAAERGTDGAALASVWTAAKAAYLDHSIADLITRVKGLNDIHDDIAGITPGATAAEVWAYATRRLTNLSDARAAYIDQLDFPLKEKLNEIDAEVEGLGGAAMRGTDGAALASSYTAARAVKLDNLDAKVSDAKYFNFSALGLVDDIAVPFNPAATGTYINPGDAIDNNTGTGAEGSTIGNYLDLTWDFEFVLSTFRLFRKDTPYSPTARIKIAYHNGVSFVDWQTNIPVSDSAAWSGWYEPGTVHVKGKKIRITTTALDGNDRCYLMEIELGGILIHKM